MEARIGIGAALLACVLLGCPKPSPPETDAGAKVEDASRAAPSAASSISLVQVDAGVNLMEIVSEVKSRKDARYAALPLFEKLSVERQDRPQNTLRAETLYDGLQKQGVKISNRHQVLGQIVGAGYCLKADAEPDIDLTVCEFDDEAKMAKGKKEITSIAYPRREIVTSKTSTIGIGRLSEAQATTDMAKKIVAYIKTL